ncbi:MAG: aminopeptidase P family protein [Bacteroidota bacterium]
MPTNRIVKIKNKLTENKLDAFLITFPPHIRYVSGFAGTSCICFITKRNKFLLIDERYSVQAKNQAHGWKILVAEDSLFEGLKKYNLIRSDWKVGVDGNNIVLTQYKSLKKLFPETHFYPKVGFIEEFTSIKDKTEIAKIKKAVGITDRVFEKILEYIKPGIYESEIAVEITYLHRKYGAAGDAFKPIVTSGVNGAMPHASTSEKKIKNGEMVTLDFGCTVDGYNSDLTRTVFVGKPKSFALKLYKIVAEAQKHAIGAAKPGISARELDAVARNLIRGAGYGDYFTHSLGHGIGLQVHEPPRVSAKNKVVLQEGNVITIEPGIYIPGFGGVRIEDDVVIRNGDAEILNKAIKEPIVI